MKKMFFILALIPALLMGCASTTEVSGVPDFSLSENIEISNNFDFSDFDFSGVPGNEWKLTEVRVNGANTGFNRNALTRDGMGESFTLTFDAELINGVGAPNRYSAPYTLGEGRAINISLVRATLMASITEPPNLREHDFFGYIQNTYRWNVTNNNLTLNSRTEDGREVVLVFSR